MDTIKKVKTTKKVSNAQRDEIYDGLVSPMDYEAFLKNLEEMFDKKILKRVIDNEHYDVVN